ISVSSKFQAELTPLLQPIQRLLATAPYATLMGLISSSYSRILEKRLWSILSSQNNSQLSILGAIQLERDISGIVGVVAVFGGWKVRSEFTRCVQIGMLLGMAGEDGDDDDEEEDNGIEWVLSDEERRKVRNAVAKGSNF